ncbi:MAG: ribosome assembly RNA-binding protein YhbY [Clostridiales bacterium]|jgi:RNA-binding protein|nr:ribosome assembly RNA-binding protein YhbY [Clostridiales bacterium]MDR2752366.1 ribosome assembly RNA-binding protein YhbY [Clostridiales bacterium]
MLNSKQRAFLRGKATSITPIAQVGKAGATPEMVASIDQALEARELVKLSVLNNCEEPAEEVAEKISGRTRSQVVQVIGRKIVLYRKAKKPALELPK